MHIWLLAEPRSNAFHDDQQKMHRMAQDLKVLLFQFVLYFMLQRNSKPGIMFHDEMLRKAFWWEHVALFISSTELCLDRMGFTSLNSTF